MAEVRVAAVSGPVTGGRGWAFGSPADDLAGAGFVVEEFLLEGVAVSYRLVEGSTAGRDGRWDTEEDGSAQYRVRMYVVRPADAARFNGVVLVNWQNVTIGYDLGAPSMADLEAGFVWVGVTAQRVAVEGQEGVAGVLPTTQGLPVWDPERYGSLSHPGDAFSYDIFSQAGRAVSAGRPTAPVDPLGGLEPRTVLAIGASQSAMRLGSYLNIAHRRDRVYDGFFPSIHWGICPYPPDEALVPSMAPLGDGWFANSSQIRDEGDVPILVLCTESETMHNYVVRQPDTDSFRFWEMAGTAHASGDARAEREAIFERDGIAGALPVGPEQNQVSWAYVRDAALRRLVDWVDSGRPPRVLPPIDVEPGAPGRIVRDQHGNAVGGVRLPDLEAPTATHLGTNTDSPLAALAGASKPFPTTLLVELYGTADGYVQAWDAAVDRLVDVELVLPGDEAALRARGRTAADHAFAATTPHTA